MATERIDQLETLVNMLHEENVALKASQSTSSIHSALSDLALAGSMSPDMGYGGTPGTPLNTPRAVFTPGQNETPLSELLQSCKRARQRAEILMSAKSPMGTPMGSFKRT